MQAVAVKLMDVGLGLFTGFADKDALALVVDLHHVFLRLFPVPPEDDLEDMGHVIHEVHRVIPADHDKAGIQLGIGLGLGDDLLVREDLRWCRLGNGRSLSKPHSMSRDRTAQETASNARLRGCWANCTISFGTESRGTSFMAPPFMTASLGMP